MKNDLKQSLEAAQEICLLGIGGSGMRGLAALLTNRSKNVTGTDSNFEAIQNDPLLNKYQLASENNAEKLIESADLVIYSDALSADHPLRLLAQKHDVPEFPYIEIVGAIANDYETTIAIAGTHGKSSTTAFLAHILEQAGYDPTVLLGATVKNWPLGNARIGKNKYFIIEADEYRNHFFSINPQHIILTAIDFDHPDFFSSLEDVCNSYQTFINKLPPNGKLVSTSAIINERTNIKWPQQTIAVSTNTPAITIPIPGDHMQSNARLAVALAVQLGIAEEDARASLARFPGLGRRFEMIGKINTMNVISDYGHHPKEIEVTLQGARTQYPHQRILAIVEPHMEKRLVTFLDQYVNALKGNCDGVLICPIYRARKEDNANHTSNELVKNLIDRHVIVDEISSYEQLADKLNSLSSQYDVAIAFTAGELDQHLRQISVKNN